MFVTKRYDNISQTLSTLRLGLDANYPPSILNQSKLGEFFAPLAQQLFVTGSSKGDPLEILEDEIANENMSSSDLLSKNSVGAIEATVPDLVDRFKEIEVKDATKSTRKRSLSIVSLKEKVRPITSPISRSLSSLTLLGSKKSRKQEKEKTMSRVRSASTVQLSEVRKIP